MVDGTGLENQRAKASQVRILSFPPLIRYENNPYWDYFLKGC